MSYQGIQIFCLQAFLVQHVFSQCLLIKAPRKNSATPVVSVPTTAFNLAGPVGYRCWTGSPWRWYGYRAGYGGRSKYGNCAPIFGSYGGAGSGNVAVDGVIPVAGNTAIGGQMPIVGAVKFGGTAPAAGTVTITATCIY